MRASLVLAVVALALLAWPWIATAQTSSPGPATITVSVDRGDGAVYYVDEAITVYVTVSQPGHVRLTDTVAGAPAPGVREWYVLDQSCFTAPIDPPLGDEVLVAELLGPSRRPLASARTRFRTQLRPGGPLDGWPVALGAAAPMSYATCALVVPLASTLPDVARRTLASVGTQERWSAATSERVLWPVLAYYLLHPDELEQVPAADAQAAVDNAIRFAVRQSVWDHLRYQLDPIDAARAEARLAWCRESGA
jgi:hypothetical protein